MELAIINGTYRDSQSKNASRKSFASSIIKSFKPIATREVRRDTNHGILGICYVLYRKSMEFLPSTVAYNGPWQRCCLG